MTAQKAIKLLDYMAGENILYKMGDKEISAIEMAMEALEKQIPKKPIKHFVNPFGFPYYECPICGESDVCGQKYCDECGQKLDWSEQNE